jgi:hypothetical protein
MSNDTTQLGPRVDKAVGDDYRVFTEILEGKTKGRISRCSETAFQLHMGLIYMTNPEMIEESEVLNEEVDEPEEVLERFDEYRKIFREQIIEAVTSYQTRQRMAALEEGVQQQTREDTRNRRSRQREQMNSSLRRGYEELFGPLPDGSAHNREELRQLHEDVNELQEEVRRIEEEEVEKQEILSSIEELRSEIDKKEN